MWISKRCETAFYLLAFLFVAVDTYGLTKNGFKLDNALVPRSAIVSGGPPRDGIPAIDRPQFVTNDEVDFLSQYDRVLGLVINGKAKAYPIKILNWHEIVNDTIDNQHFVVTFCPLCGTGMVFASDLGQGKRMRFGVSGLLYNSDVLLYDRNTESLWSQLMAQAISGPLKGTRLVQLPALHTSFGDWRKRYPESQVLSTNTGFDQNYKRSPYRGYEKTRRLYFGVSQEAPGTYHPKEQVLGIQLGNLFKAYPFKELSAGGHSKFEDEFNGQSISVYWDEAARSAFVMDEAGRILPTTISFWFAWYTFHPRTEVFTAK